MLYLCLLTLNIHYQLYLGMLCQMNLWLVNGVSRAEVLNIQTSFLLPSASEKYLICPLYHCPPTLLAVSPQSPRQQSHLRRDPPQSCQTDQPCTSSILRFRPLQSVRFLFME